MALAFTIESSTLPSRYIHAAAAAPDAHYLLGSASGAPFTIISRSHDARYRDLETGHTHTGTAAAIAIHEGRPQLAWCSTADEVSWTADGTSGRAERVVDGLSGPSQRHLALALDPDGTPVLLIGTGKSILLARRTGGSWSVEQIATGCVMSAALAVDASGNAHVAWFDMNDRRTHLATRGAQVIVVDADHAGRWSVHLAIDADGIPHLAFVDSSKKTKKHVVHGVWRDGRFESSRAIENVPIPIDIGFALDAQQRPLVMAHGTKAQGLVLARREGKTWERVQVLPGLHGMPHLIAGAAIVGTFASYDEPEQYQRFVVVT